MRKHLSTNNILKNKFLIASMITAAVLMLLYLLELTFGSFFAQIDLHLQNIFYRSGYSKSVPVSNNILIVTIDDRTLQDKEKGGLGRWQNFSRTNYAKVIDNLKRDGAAVIGLDILFSETSNKKDDEILAASFKKAGNLVSGFSRKSVKSEALFPLNIFRDTASRIGFFNPNISGINFNVYSIAPYTVESNMYYEPFGLSVLRTYYDSLLGVKTAPQKQDFQSLYYAFYPKKGVTIPYTKNDRGQNISSEDEKEILIRYTPEQGRYKTLSFVDVYNGRYDKTAVQDSIVLIGSTATALKDDFLTPVGNIPGVYVHANLINTVLTKNYLQYLTMSREILILICFTFLITLLGVYTKNKFYIISSAILVSIGYFSMYQILFTFSGKIFAYPTLFFATILASFTFINIYRYIYEDKGKRLLKNALSQYLAEDLVVNVLNNYEEVKLGGTKKEITTFFSDIEGFTTLSENMDPEELVRFLSLYLKDASDIIMHHHGFINKYEGDAIMALWGALTDDVEQSTFACRAALEQQEKITHLNHIYKEKFGITINVRMGISRGQAVVGNIGSLGKKIEFTALGDTVNTAARLESINKAYKTNICVTESIYEHAKQNYVFRKIDNIRVKGKDNALNIYELIGPVGAVASERIELIRAFEKNLDLYFEGKFEQARDGFYSLLVDTGDKTSQIFAARCEHLIANPPEEWKGIWTATEK